MIMPTLMQYCVSSMWFGVTLRNEESSRSSLYSETGVSPTSCARALRTFQKTRNSSEPPSSSSPACRSNQIVAASAPSWVSSSFVSCSHWRPQALKGIVTIARLFNKTFDSDFSCRCLYSKAAFAAKHLLKSEHPSLDISNDQRCHGWHALLFVPSSRASCELEFVHPDLIAYRLTLGHGVTDGALEAGPKACWLAVPQLAQDQRWALERVSLLPSLMNSRHDLLAIGACAHKVSTCGI